MKILNVSDANGARQNISDLDIWGDVDKWKLICKASSKNGGWMKSTKAMEVPGVGCIVQVTTQQGDNIAEALSFVPFTTIVDVRDGDTVIGRNLEVLSPNMESEDVFDL